MSIKDWVITQNQDPAIGEITYLINNKRLKGRKVSLTGYTNYQTIFKAA